MKLKYIVIDHLKPVLFGEYLNHSDFSHMGKITSAGFVTLREVKTDFEKYPNLCCCEMMEADCYGESISLNMKPDKNDYILIQRIFNS